VGAEAVGVGAGRGVPRSRLTWRRRRRQAVAALREAEALARGQLLGAAARRRALRPKASISALAAARWSTASGFCGRRAGSAGRGPGCK
jgi:hypothetical protein